MIEEASIEVLHRLGDRDHRAYMMMVEKFVSLTKDVTLIDRWNYNPLYDSRSVSGFVGINNLGCICYMNSLMQQFFMQEKLRKCLLSVPLRYQKTSSSKDGTFDAKNSLLLQLKNMFHYLQLSQLKSYNPSPWCYAYKGEDGKPTNYTIQHDAQEYFNVLCDRIESELRGSEYSDLVQSVFCGTTINQLICQGKCNKTRNRSENFYCLSLNVQGMKTIYESLNDFISGESLSDYYCEDCQKKEHTVKRMCLGELNDTLILHLKRFQFNFDTFLREKVNDFFEFPLELDLFPYSIDGVVESNGEEQPPNKNLHNNVKKKQAKDDNYFNYKLKGVVIHVGTADSGHYYSLIKDNVNKKFGKEEKWFEFNDSNVTEFDISSLSDECFGGTQDNTWYNNSTRSYVTREIPVFKNAYMLVYERIKNSVCADASNTIDTASNTIDTASNIIDTASNIIGDNRSSTSADASEERALSHTESKCSNEEVEGDVKKETSIQEELDFLDVIKKENHDLCVNQALINQNFFNWLLNLCQTGSEKYFNPENLKKDTFNNNFIIGPLGNDFIDAVFRFCVNVWSSAMNTSSLIACLNYLETIVSQSKNITACHRVLKFIMLGENNHTIHRVLLHQPEAAVREAFGKFLLVVLSTLFNVDRHKLLEKVIVNISDYHQSDYYDTNDDNNNNNSIVYDNNNDIVNDKKSNVEINESFEDYASLVSQFISRMCSHHTLDEACMHWKQFQEFFDLLSHCIGLGWEMKELAVHNLSLIMKLVDLPMGYKSPVADIFLKNPAIQRRRSIFENKNRNNNNNNNNNNKYQQDNIKKTSSIPNWTTCFLILSTLVRSCHTQLYEIRSTISLPGVRNIPPIPASMLCDGPPMHMKKIDRKCIVNSSFYSWSLSNLSDAAVSHVSDILCHWSWGWQEYSLSANSVILNGLNAANFDEVDPYFIMLDSYLRIDDHLKRDRCTQLVSSPHGLLHCLNLYRKGYPKFTFQSLRFLLVLQERHVHFRETMMEQQGRWSWWFEYLKQHLPTKDYNLNHHHHYNNGDRNVINNSESEVKQFEDDSYTIKDNGHSNRSMSTSITIGNNNTTTINTNRSGYAADLESSDIIVTNFDAFVADSTESVGNDSMCLDPITVPSNSGTITSSIEIDINDSIELINVAVDRKYDTYLKIFKGYAALTGRNVESIVKNLSEIEEDNLYDIE